MRRGKGQGPNHATVCSAAAAVLDGGDGGGNGGGAERAGRESEGKPLFIAAGFGDRGAAVPVAQERRQEWKVPSTQPASQQSPSFFFLI